MSVLQLNMSGDAAFFEEAQAVAAAAKLAADYRSAAPFPHIVLDDFLPSAATEKVLAEFPRDIIGEQERTQELYKGFRLPDDLPQGFARALFYGFNGRPFLRFLEELTGIEGLIPDPYYLGGGFHETRRGGRLGIHADFNLHKKMRLRRRINVLVYLNREWDESYGGALELWSQDMSRKEKSIAPRFNRCVIFNTDATSWHGHPDPLACPESITRKSLALYYYTASDAIFSEEKVKTTVFKTRPGSGDKFDWYIRTKYFLRDCVPPVLLRAGLRLVKGKERL